MLPSDLYGVFHFPGVTIMTMTGPQVRARRKALRISQSQVTAAVHGFTTPEETARRANDSKMTSVGHDLRRDVR